MRQPGRAYAIFRAKTQGPELSQRLREFRSRMPELELSLKTPSYLNEDIHLAVMAAAAWRAGSNVALIATDKESSNGVTAGELKAVLRLLCDLIDGSFHIYFKDKSKYRSA